MNQNHVPLGDPYILLSWINMKLRNECKSLDELCERYGISIQEIIDQLKSIGYMYETKMNQFIAQSEYE